MRETELKKLIVEEFLASIEDPRVVRTRKHALEQSSCSRCWRSSAVPTVS
jgi:hypothetical protein